MKNFEPLDNTSPSTETENKRHEDTENFLKELSASSGLPILPSSAPTPPVHLLVYLIPIIGFFPSVWTLYRRQGTREQLTVSRLSITLMFTWFLGYLLLTTGAATSEFLTLRLLILNSFLTSGYFLVSILLIIRTVKGKSPRLPGFSRLAERGLGKYLS